MGHRKGRGQILTANQLADRLAIPCFYLLIGRANVSFPYSSTPSPSGFVQVVLTRPPLRRGDVVFFPVTVNWRQWRDVVVPILEDHKWTHYLGSTGSETQGNSGGVPTTELGHGLFADSFREFIRLLKEALRQGAIDSGSCSR